MPTLEIPDCEMVELGDGDDYPSGWTVQQRIERDIAIRLGNAGIDPRQPLMSWYDPMRCVTVYAPLLGLHFTGTAQALQ